jgi:hypothetical protein
LPLTNERTESANASPTLPAPGASPVPRANTTCASGQDVTEPAVRTESSARELAGTINSTP